MKDGASKIYTKGGDKGKTSLIGGARVAKSELRLDCYGTVDELNCVIGMLRSEIKSEVGAATDLNQIDLELKAIQLDLFNAGSQLACEDEKIRIGLPNVTPSGISALEKSMDTYSLKLIPLKNFVLPGGSKPASMAHLARTVCRRAERLCVALSESNSQTDSGENQFSPLIVQYLNRLSDYFFVLARFLNHFSGIAEPIWEGKQSENNSLKDHKGT